MSNQDEKVIKLPRLGLLTPTMDSTLLKIMEESGELARAVLTFLDGPISDNISNISNISEHAAASRNDASSNYHNKTRLLIPVAEELLDVAQTCVTMIFVLEDTYGIDPGEMIGMHLDKLRKKGYPYNPNIRYYVQSNGQYKYLNLPRLDIPQVTLLKTVCKIQEEIGELTQVLGKNSGKSGERGMEPDINKLLRDSTLELLDIAQCCFTMLYILEEKYNVDMDGILLKHLEKLKAKGYCS